MSELKANNYTFPPSEEEKRPGETREQFLMRRVMKYETYLQLDESTSTSTIREKGFVFYSGSSSWEGGRD